MLRPIIDTNNIKRLAELIDGASNVVITTHMSPDGDAIGSSLAMWHVMEALGKSAKVVVPDEPSKQLSFLPGFKEIVAFTRYSIFAKELLAHADLIFCLDYNGLKRIDRVAPAVEEASAPKVMIDHHLDPEPFCDVTISHPDQSSASVVLFRTLAQLEFLDLVDEKAASCIMSGMMTDTGNFSYNANDPEIYLIVARLLEMGANRDDLSRRLFDTFSESYLRIQGYATSRKMEVNRDMGAALIWLNREELNRMHYTRGDTEGLVNRPLAIPGIRYSVFLREEEHYIKVSMRSTGDFPCDIICSRYFGGGGHKNAAGGEFRGSMEQAIEVFHRILPENKKLYIK